MVNFQKYIEKPHYWAENCIEQVTILLEKNVLFHFYDFFSLENVKKCEQLVYKIVKNSRKHEKLIFLMRFSHTIP